MKYEFFGRRFLWLFPFCFLALFCSCSKCPEGFPKVYPFELKVNKGGAPVAGVQIMFRSSTGAGNSLAIGGTTDENGTAVIRTRMGQYCRDGLPEGEWRVNLIKAAVLPEEKTPEELAKMTENERDKYRLDMEQKAKKLPPEVPYLLGDSQLSPLVYKMGNAANKWEVNIADYKDTPESIKKATFVPKTE